MDELKHWLILEIEAIDKLLDIAEKQRPRHDTLIAEKWFMKQAYNQVLKEINKLNPSFCATCGKETNGNEFCSQECSEYETLE